MKKLRIGLGRSPVFETMFQHQMKETNTGVIEITDLHSKTISVLLHFIYTGTLLKNWSTSEVIIELVNAAHKYQLKDLCEFLDQVVGNLCDKETVGKLFNLAKKLSMKKAEKDLFEYMKAHISNWEDMMSFASDTTLINLFETEDDDEVMKSESE